MVRFLCMYPNAQAGQRAREVADTIGRLLPAELNTKIAVVLLEAVANALQANERSNGTYITVGLFYNGEQVTMTVADQGSGFDHRPYLGRPMPQPWELNGRGIPLMQAHADSLHFVRTKKGMRVAAKWRV